MDRPQTTLYLIPVPLAEDTHDAVLPRSIADRVAQLHHFLCENQRSARRFVSKLKVHARIEDLDFRVLDKDTPADALAALMEPLLSGHDMGVMSEAGCPGVADPGALAVQFAHAHGIRVVPLTGPSSLLLALMASGLNGQHFAFQGYLPVDAGQRGREIKRFESLSKTHQQTQLFIETPYRNQALFDDLLRHLQPDTRLCVAYNLTAPTEWIRTLHVRDWKKAPVRLDKEPAVFIFLGA